MKLSLINCAVASDGGSIALSFITEENEEYWVSLDKGLGSPTINKIFASGYGETPLSSVQEKGLLSHLESAKVAEADCDSLLQQVINEIKCR